MSLKIGRMVVGPVSTNCYFVYDENTRNTLVIDPGAKGGELYDRLKDNGLDIKAILLTHGHFDHIMGVNEMKEKAGVLVYAHEAEEELCREPELNCSAQIRKPYSVSPNVLLHDNEEIKIAGIRFKTIYTPGHTIGSCCFYFEEDGLLLCGDTLFLNSCGRTDLPTGSASQLTQSLRKLMELPDDVRCYPGHDDITSIGDERRYNPFIEI